MMRRYRQNTAMEMESKIAMFSRKYFKVSGKDQNKQ
jgi:hypothetical protein